MEYYELIRKGKTYNRLFIGEKPSRRSGEHPQEIIKGYAEFVADEENPLEGIVILHDWGARFYNLKYIVVDILGGKEVYAKNCYHFYKIRDYNAFTGYFGPCEIGDDSFFD